MQYSNPDIEQTLIWIRSYFEQLYTVPEQTIVSEHMPVIHLYKKYQRITLQKTSYSRTVQVLDWQHPDRTCLMYIKPQPVIYGTTLFMEQQDELPFFVLDALTAVLRNPENPLIDEAHVRKVLHRTNRLTKEKMCNTQASLHDRLYGSMYQIWKNAHPNAPVMKEDFENDETLCARTWLINMLEQKK